jgi:hypothetical protein
MYQKSITNYIWFGQHLRYLIAVIEGWPIHGDGYIVANIERVFEHLKEFDLPVTLRSCTPLEEILKELKALPPESKITQEQATRLNNIVIDIRKVLEAESSGKLTYTVTEKRLDVSKLLYDVASLFGKNVFTLLPDIAKYDFNEAGLCIAFSRPTAAAFHLLRGTESVLREFYCSRVKRNRVSSLLWGPIVAHLRKRKSPPPEVLLNNLDNIRVSYRNPTQHPELRYDIDEAQDLFGLCVEVVNRMFKHM